MVSSRTAEDVLTTLDPEERRWVEEFRDRIRAKLGPRVRDLRIFGSKVRGEGHEESDIDLLVLMDRYDGDIGRQIVEMAHEISPWLAPMVRDFDRYHAPASRATGIYEEIRRESVRL